MSLSKLVWAGLYGCAVLSTLSAASQVIMSGGATAAGGATFSRGQAFLDSWSDTARRITLTVGQKGKDELGLITFAPVASQF